MMLYFRLFAGFTSFMVNRWSSQRFSIGPDGVLDFSSMRYLTSPTRIETGTEMNPAIKIQENTAANFLIIGV